MENFKRKTVEEWLASVGSTCNKKLREVRNEVEFLDDAPADIFDRNRANFLQELAELMN